MFVDHAVRVEIGITKGGVRVGWGVFQLIIATIALSTLINVLLLFFLHRTTTRLLHLSFLALKEEIANAIQQVLGGNIQPTEPINPFQMLLIDYVKANMTKKSPDLEILRGDDGKFQ